MSAILFLGAGASNALGFPTTKEFMQDANKMTYGEVYNEVVDFCKKKYASQVVDIEQVLWELKDFDTWFDSLSRDDAYRRWLMLTASTVGNPRLLKEKGAKVVKLITDVYKLVYDVYWKDGTDSTEVYRPLMKLIPEPLDIYTTNYDLCIENAFSNADKLNGYFTDGFNYNGTTIKWDKSNYDGHKVKLYKLHGSVNWKRAKNKTEGIWRVIQHDFTGHEDQCMIYPGFKDKPAEEPFAWLHEQLGESLIKAQCCITIGFSFRDNYINTLFTDALWKNPKLKIVMWNPDLPKHPFKTDRVVHWPEKFGSMNKGQVKRTNDFIQDNLPPPF
jgi:hypothetical protein